MGSFWVPKCSILDWHFVCLSHDPISRNRKFCLFLHLICLFILSPLVHFQHCIHFSGTCRHYFCSTLILLVLLTILWYFTTLAYGSIVSFKLFNVGLQCKFIWTYFYVNSQLIVESCASPFKNLISLIYWIPVFSSNSFKLFYN